MCYVNSAMQALAWCTLLCKGLTPSCWAYGFELLRGLCQWNPFPLNLRTFQPFLWLLFGAFTAEDLTAQQDILEFATFIIDRMGPTFLSCRWCTKFQWVTKESHPLLDSEKGDRFAPILMRFIDHTVPQCTLRDLISFWHDSSGLCRASDQASRCLVLMFDRHIDGQNQKCIQAIDIADGTVEFPCFADAEGQIQFLTFHIAAVTFHIGHGPNTGHHRTALKYHGSRLIYDDNKLPDHVDQLTDEILCNMTMTWLVYPDNLSVRTMHAKPDTTKGTNNQEPTDANAATHLQLRPPSQASASSSSAHTTGSATNRLLNDTEKDAALIQEPKRARLDPTAAAETTRSDELLSCVESSTENAVHTEPH